MDVNSLISLLEWLKNVVPSPYFEVLAVVAVILALVKSVVIIQGHRLDNQNKRLNNTLLQQKISQPPNNNPTPSAPTPGE
ncbi:MULTISPECIES: hypothetical protein [Bacillus]|uniref:hypothetical protein n=1 Tax=Bacillus TaxID=1386 RepID=UPI0024073CFD|nr:hypothetical protein [Bacillus cereus]MDF9633168.1 hypothetical protein [Bacillus cereus]MDG1588238.1 hypothetical protein [Bacillus cereus]